MNNATGTAARAGAQDISTSNSLADPPRIRAAMASVRIDSGAVEATHLLRHVPQNKWRELMLARRNFMAIKLSYDCRCLVTFVNDAKVMFEALGFSSVEQTIRDGYGLEPAEIDVAVRWLELNPPTEPISLDDARAEAAKRAQEIDAATPDLLPVGRPKENVRDENDVTNISPRSDTVPYAIARLRKDRPDIHARVLAGELSPHAGMVEAGFRKRAVRKATTPHERALEQLSTFTPSQLLELRARIDELLGSRADAEVVS